MKSPTCRHFLLYLDLSNSLLAGHLKGVSVLGTQEELHLDAGRKCVVIIWQS